MLTFFNQIFTVALLGVAVFATLIGPSTTTAWAQNRSPNLALEQPTTVRVQSSQTGSGKSIADTLTQQLRFIGGYEQNRCVLPTIPSLLSAPLQGVRLQDPSRALSAANVFTVDDIGGVTFNPVFIALMQAAQAPTEQNKIVRLDIEDTDTGRIHSITLNASRAGRIWSGFVAEFKHHYGEETLATLLNNLGYAAVGASFAFAYASLHATPVGWVVDVIVISLLALWALTNGWMLFRLSTAGDYEGIGKHLFTELNALLFTLLGGGCAAQAIRRIPKLGHLLETIADIAANVNGKSPVLTLLPGGQSPRTPRPRSLRDFVPREGDAFVGTGALKLTPQTTPQLQALPSMNTNALPIIRNGVVLMPSESPDLNPTEEARQLKLFIDETKAAQQGYQEWLSRNNKHDSVESRSAYQRVLAAQARTSVSNTVTAQGDSEDDASSDASDKAKPKENSKKLPEGNAFYVVREEPGQYGGTLYTRVRRELAPVNDFVTEAAHSFSKTGFLVFPELMSALGIRQVDGFLDGFTYPDLVEVNGYIESMWQSEFPISLRFEAVDGMIPDEVMVQMWSEGKIPYARDGSLHFHDFGTHWSFLILPERVVKESQAKFTFIIDLLTNPILQKNRVMKAFTEPLFFQSLSAELDRGTAGLGGRLAELMLAISKRKPGSPEDIKDNIGAGMNIYHVIAGHILNLVHPRMKLPGLIEKEIVPFVSEYQFVQALIDRKELLGWSDAQVEELRNIQARSRPLQLLPVDAACIDDPEDPYIVTRKLAKHIHQHSPYRLDCLLNSDIDEIIQEIVDRTGLDVDLSDYVPLIHR